VTVPAAHAERALAEASDALGTGCREDVGPGGTAVLDFWVGERAADPRALEARLAGEGIPARVAASPEGNGWRDAMRAFHRPVEVAGRLRVRPPWEAPRPPLLDVAIDPGMAFGTAQHPTTRGCLELLAGLPPGGGLLDAGCGSGVLAVAARRLGFDPVWAIDADPLSVEATLANARRNGVGLAVGRRTIGADRLPRAPTVVANLTASALAVLADAIGRPGPRRLVASGLRPEEVAATAARFSAAGLAPSRTLEEDGWSTLLLERR
jgi:ribosomal protein L11 methyltransferase